MKSDEYDIGRGKKTKKRREERGFRGTFLTSSPSKDTCDTEAKDDEETKSILSVDVAAS
jgi:hypothetical protein